MNRTLAHTISWLGNPGFLAIGVLITGVVLTKAFSHQTILSWLGILALVSLAGTIILGIAWARGVVLDADLMTPVNLHERGQVLLVFMSLILLMLFGSFRLGQHQPLHAILVTLLVLGLLVAGITIYWKISLHMLGVGIFCTGLILMSQEHWWPVLVIIPLVAWARLRLKRHTPLQVLGGLTVSALVTVLVFSLYNLI